MLSVGCQKNPNIYFNNRNIATNNLNKSQNNFRGNVVADAFVRANHMPVFNNGELKRTADALSALGVSELEIGNNIYLANLLESAVRRVDDLVYDVPTRIRCEAEHFEKNRDLRTTYQKAYPQYTYNPEDVPAGISWDAECASVPIIYFNPKYNWQSGTNNFKIQNDKRFIMWHEIGHWIHIKNHGNNPQWITELSEIQLSPFQGSEISRILGRFRADNPVPETIADTFGMLMLGRSYSKMPSVLRDIYEQYRGPMPRFRASNGG